MTLVIKQKEVQDLLKNETDEKKVEIFLRFGQINLKKRNFFFYYLNNYLIRTSPMVKNDYILKFFNEYKETFKKN